MKKSGVAFDQYLCSGTENGNMSVTETVRTKENYSVQKFIQNKENITHVISVFKDTFCGSSIMVWCGLVIAGSGQMNGMLHSHNYIHMLVLKRFKFVLFSCVFTVLFILILFSHIYTSFLSYTDMN